MYQDPLAALTQSTKEATANILMPCFEQGDSELPYFVIATGQKVVSGEPIEPKRPEVLKQALGLRGDMAISSDNIQERVNTLTQKYKGHDVIATGFRTIGNQLLEASQRPA